MTIDVQKSGSSNGSTTSSESVNSQPTWDELIPSTTRFIFLLDEPVVFRMLAIMLFVFVPIGPIQAAAPANELLKRVGPDMGLCVA